jgi:hypothetical protein
MFDFVYFGDRLCLNLHKHETFLNQILLVINANNTFIFQINNIYLGDCGRNIDAYSQSETSDST